MRKYINGRRYCTDTAKKMAAYYSEYSVTDFNYYSETLYLKRNGEYFLHGQGNGLSRYAVWTGNSGHGGEKIMPFTLEEAKAWAEENLDGEEYESIFAPDPEDDEMSRLNLLVPAVAKIKLERLSQETGKSQSQIVADLIDAH